MPPGGLSRPSSAGKILAARKCRGAGCLRPGHWDCNHAPYYDCLGGLALHRAGNREQAAVSFQRYFAQRPSDIPGATTVALLDAED